MNLFQHVAQDIGDGSPDGLRCRDVAGHGIAPDWDAPVPICGDGVSKRVQCAADESLDDVWYYEFQAAASSPTAASPS